MNARDMKVVHGMVANIAGMCATLMDYLEASHPTADPAVDQGGDGTKPNTDDVVDKIQAASARMELPPMLGRHRNPVDAGQVAPAPRPDPIHVPDHRTPVTGAEGTTATD